MLDRLWNNNGRLVYLDLKRADGLTMASETPTIDVYNANGYVAGTSTPIISAVSGTYVSTVTGDDGSTLYRFKFQITLTHALALGTAGVTMARVVSRNTGLNFGVDLLVPTETYSGR